MKKINSLFRKMFPGTDYTVLSRKEGVLVTTSGLPLKGLLLPNVESIQVLGREEDKFAEVFGIKRAVDRHLLVHRMDSNAGNRFLIKALDRLNKYSLMGESGKFDTLARILEKQSIAFRTVCLFRVEHKWYKKLTATQVEKCWWKVNRLAQRDASDYRYTHVEIDKEDGSKRPLCVPPLHWRVWANMKYTLAWLWVRNHGYPEWNHGGIAGKGVNSCWRELWLNVLQKNYSNIYEYDLSKFFDRVGHFSIERGLIATEMPDRMREWCLSSLQNKKGKVPADVAAKLLLTKLRLDPDDETYEGALTPEDTSRLEKLALTGVPQGYSLSPMLACLGKAYAFTKPNAGVRKLLRTKYIEETNIRELLLEYHSMLSWWWQKRIIAYMDDGILFGNKRLNDSAIERFKDAMDFIGAPVNEAKSRWLKRDGKWQVESFKFLGVEYYPGTQWIQARTRKGATMSFPAKDLEKSVDLRGPSGQVFAQYLKGHSEITTSMKWGFFDAILSRMWADGRSELNQGSTELVAHPQSFVSYYKEYYYKTGPKGPRTPFTLTNASSRASRMLHSAHQELALRSRVRRQR